MAAPPRFLDILRRLLAHEVDFILVGGVAAILEGAPVSTFDLDVVFLPTEDNSQRLLAALRDLNARYLDPAGRYIVPDADKLATLRLHQLLTDYGPLDVLRTIGHGLGYSELAEHTRAQRDKDRAALPVLRRTLELRKKG